MKELEQYFQEEEKLREQVNRLPEELKKKYYCELEKRIKDPDMYQTLTYAFFLFGINHLYLNKKRRFLVNLLFFIFSLVSLKCCWYVSVILIISLIVFELYSLVNSELIVKKHNIDTMKDILDEL